MIFLKVLVPVVVVVAVLVYFWASTWVRGLYESLFGSDL